MKKIKTSGRGRKCRYPRCEHILSIYNHDEYCHIHLGCQFENRRPKLQKHAVV